MATLLFATDYVILRDVKADGKIRIPMERKPKKVATIIDEQAFLENGAMVHNKTVFLEDQTHDWRWIDGYLMYYTRVAEVADVVVAFETSDAPAKTPGVGYPGTDTGPA